MLKFRLPKNLTSGYSWLNVIGLTLAFTFGFLIFTYIYIERSYDLGYPNHQQVYRLGVSYDISGNVDNFSNIARPVGPNMANDYAGIQTQTRVAGYNGLYAHKAFFDYNENQVSSSHVFYADSTFFDVFERKFISGSSQNPLSSPKSIVLTQSLAQKIFGNKNPIDKTIELDGDTKVRVTGVIEDLNFKTHLPFQAILSWDLGARQGENDVWIGWHVYTYLKFQNNYSMSELKEAFPTFAQKYMKETMERVNAKVDIIVQPLSSIHLNSSLNWEAYQNNKTSNIWILGSIGIFLLLIAIVNYINLTTARAAQRAKEIGIRKVMGSSKSLLIWKFLYESLTITILSAFFSLILVVLIWSSYNELSSLQLTIYEALNIKSVLLYLISTLTIGFIAGLYPAFHLSNIPSSVVLRGKYLTSNGGTLLRKFLVTFQFATSIALIIGTIVFLRQLEFISTSDLGFNSKSVMVIKVQNNPSDASLIGLLNRLKSNSYINDASVSSSVPGEELNQTFFSVPDDIGTYNSHGGQFMQVDGGFVEMIGMEISEGRDFIYNSENDKNSSIMLNQAAVINFGWKGDAVGKKIGYGTDSLGNNILFEVIGVIKDFHIGSMHTKIEPIAIFLNSDFEKNVFIRLNSKNIKNAIDFVKEEWSTFDSKYPMDYKFLDDNYQAYYANDERLFTLLKFISLTILFVSLLGLIGLVTFSVNVRKREISIRRVVGSTPIDIYKLLSQEYIVLLSIAFVTGTFAAWYFLEDWLSTFHYRIDIQGWEFLITLVSVSIAVISVLLFISTKAIKENPSNVLRTE